MIGQQGNIDGEFWHGDIAELLVYRRQLAPAELTSLWAELSEEYGITLSDSSNLPALRTPESLALASLCHVLLNTNEFLYVD